MLLPEERQTLEPNSRRALQRWSIVVVFGALLMALPVWLWMGQQGPREHLLGQSEEQTIELTSVERLRECSNRGQHRWAVEGTPTQGGGQESLHWEWCAPLESLNEGDIVNVWVTPSGFVAEHSATMNRLLFAACVIGVLVISVGFGVVGARRENGLRDRVREAGGSELEDPIDVVVQQDDKRRWQIRTADGSLLAPYDGAFQPALSYSPGSGAVFAGPPAAGGWSLRLAPASDQGHRIGLLVRGDERCWIQLRPGRQRTRR